MKHWQVKGMKRDGRTLSYTVEFRGETYTLASQGTPSGWGGTPCFYFDDGIDRVWVAEDGTVLDAEHYDIPAIIGL